MTIDHVHDFASVCCDTRRVFGLLYLCGRRPFIAGMQASVDPKDLAFSIGRAKVLSMRAFWRLSLRVMRHAEADAIERRRITTNDPRLFDYPVALLRLGVDRIEAILRGERNFDDFRLSNSLSQWRAFTKGHVDSNIRSDGLGLSHSPGVFGAYMLAELVRDVILEAALNLHSSPDDAPDVFCSAFLCGVVYYGSDACREAIVRECLLELACLESLWDTIETYGNPDIFEGAD
jgi:hypothetical protein